MSITIGIGIKPYGGGVVSYDSDLVTYMTGLITALSSVQKGLLNTFILSLKSGLGISSLAGFFDVAYLTGGLTKESSYRNLVKRAHDLTSPAEPTWTAFEGSQSNGTTQYLNTNYNPYTQAINYTKLNGSAGYYSRTNLASDAMADCGNYIAPDYFYMQSRIASDNMVGCLNALISQPFAGGIINSLGMFFTTRNGAVATDNKIYQNKTTPNLPSGGNVSEIPNNNIFICAYNANGVPAAFSTRQLSFFYAGKHITTAHRDVIADAVEAYMDANGKGVV